MKKKILILSIFTFLLACGTNKSNESKTEIKADNKNVNSIFQETTINNLNSLQKELKDLYQYSTESRYSFNPEKNIAISIDENNNLWFRTTDRNQKEISSIILIDLNNNNTKINLSFYDSYVTLEYSDYLKLAEKITELDQMIYPFKPVENKIMKTLVFDNFIVNNGTLAKVILEANKTNGKILRIIDKSTSEDIFLANLTRFDEVLEANKIEVINNVVNNYSDKFLSEIITLGQSYKKFDYLVKNSKEIVENDKNGVSYLSDPAYYSVEYYGDGRVKYYSDPDNYIEYSYEDAPINFVILEEKYKACEEIVNYNIKNKTYDHIWQLGEDLIPQIDGYYFSLNLSKEEKDKLNNFKNKVLKLSERYGDSSEK